MSDHIELRFLTKNEHRLAGYQTLFERSGHKLIKAPFSIDEIQTDDIDALATRRRPRHSLRKREYLRGRLETFGERSPESENRLREPKAAAVLPVPPNHQICCSAPIRYF